VIYDPAQGACAFGGGPLAEGPWMRVLYLDESGIGKISHDPHLVVAGVLVHGDRQWRELKNLLRSLLEGATPNGQPVPRFLHAKDIFHGSGEFPRDRWPEAIRHELLDNIARIPAIFRIPIIWYIVDRKQKSTEFPEEGPRSSLVNCYSIATLVCFLQAEWYMRNVIGRKELASITIEQNAELQKRIKEIYRAASQESIISKIDGGERARYLLPFQRIIDEPSFQEKTAASVLQLADYCAFAYKRAASRSLHHVRFAKPLAPATLMWDRERGIPLKVPDWALCWPIS
jgi:Protein of unknown function (DUF3800)